MSYLAKRLSELVTPIKRKHKSNKAILTTTLYLKLPLATTTNTQTNKKHISGSVLYHKLIYLFLNLSAAERFLLLLVCINALWKQHAFCEVDLISWRLPRKINAFANNPILVHYTVNAFTNNPIQPYKSKVLCFPHLSYMMGKARGELVLLQQRTGSKVNLLYSTPSCYVHHVHKANLSWAVKGDDFHPYAISPGAYWTGYFTSRSGQKLLVKYSGATLQVVAAIFN